MQALKITWRFASPLLRDGDRPIHLDALVASALMREHERYGSENAWRAADDLSSVLERTDPENVNGWVWKASMLQFQAALPRQWVNQTRRSDPRQVYEDAGKFWVGAGKQNEAGVGSKFTVDTGSGQLRGYQWLNATQSMTSAQAWAVADRDALEHYLSMISYIGKKGVNGWGLVEGFTIEEAPADEAGNWMIRTLPAGMAGKAGVQYEPVAACLRAPYWNKLARTMALDPLTSFPQ